ncbi:hypothetical protein BDQ12DRAFT_617438 [Crucibulum laeve]|uniref:FAD-binding FR-type domain-containing protein n=1 Tax=Crucibulum laeve TaxID=68775 RepID=A0A5C3LHA3_9AGAR|nr:hypothetical protein BDQ12DRAFT_617438 [Crucibulum laeve]
MSALNGRHRGECLVHQKLSLDNDPSVMTLYSHISGELPGDHAQFHTTYLPFLPVTTLDNEGRPWGSILAGKDGKPGFIKHPRYTTLVIHAMMWDGEPFLENAKRFESDGNMLAAGIGIDFSNRRRNKLAGKITKLELENGSAVIELTVNQALGNCPKYINIRALLPVTTSPHIQYSRPHMSVEDRLPLDIISFILEADTVFIGTSYSAISEDSILFPSHVGMNQRGGRAGFIRVRPSDGRTIILPDYSGNRFMTSLGNIEATPVASLTFIDFLTGDILYLTGDAHNLFGDEAQKVMPLQRALTSIYVTGYVLAKDALPSRQHPGSESQVSPYSPPIRYLAEESLQTKVFQTSERPKAILTSIELHSSTIATFTWDSTENLVIKPGQAIIMDFSSLLGARQYQHMSPFRPTAVNDDKLRTWTVSSASLSSSTRSFSITMREKEGGVVTGALFAIARKLSHLKPEALEDSRPLQLTVDIVGVTGDFSLSRKLLWIAGGIGITPFLSMVKFLVASTTTSGSRWDIHLILSTREPNILLPLLLGNLSTSGTHSDTFHLTIDLFSPQNYEQSSLPGTVIIQHHNTRFSSTFVQNNPSLADGREIYLCGPSEFENSVLSAFNDIGVEKGGIKRDNFEY